MRPSPKTVIFTLTPAVAPAVGYTISAQFRSASGQPVPDPIFQRIILPLRCAGEPQRGSLGGNCGGSTNIHELQGLGAATPDDLQVTLTGPSSILQGASVTYTVTVANSGSNALSGTDSPTIVDTVPASLTGVAWTCAASTGASCDASGSGNINTSNVTLPANGSVSYTITGTLDPAAACGTSVGNSANADFSSGARFLDPDETNNTAAVNSTVICNTTLVANPASLSYAPQQVSIASGSQAVIVTEGMNSSIISSIAVTGDYSQTNNCPAALSAGGLYPCPVNVTFTPTAEGSRNGTLAILEQCQCLAQNGDHFDPANAAGHRYQLGTQRIQLHAVVLGIDASGVAGSRIPSWWPIPTLPSPISVSAGGQYSIHGGPFWRFPAWFPRAHR